MQGLGEERHLRCRGDHCQRATGLLHVPTARPVRDQVRLVHENIRFVICRHRVLVSQRQDNAVT